MRMLGVATLQTRVVMLVDLDYFFAQVEERRNPSIRDKPVVVCVYSGRTEESGVVSTANYIARRFGVRSGMPIILAKKRLKGVEAVFLPVDHDYYEEVSERVTTILRGNADDFERVGIDEAYLEVSRRVEGDFGRAAALAQLIKGEVRDREGLTCSVGVGPNKVVAKIAADAKKPDGLTVVRPGEVVPFLSPLPADSLIGVGKKTAERLEALGVKTIGDLANYDVQRLIECFGKSLGTYLHNASNGIDDEPVQERGEAESISRIATLKEDTLDLRGIIEVTDRLCKEIHESLVQRGLSFKSVGIVAVMKDLSIRTRSRTLESPTDDVGVLRGAVKELFERFLGESEIEARRVGVRVSGLVKGMETQRRLTSFF
ncbi:MAG: DNA polymerase IV [Candidatus Verstraetearchaeota archaeon]|nr:DNA polymerase IV [Candidatus Verstraetearchaeota archaeon]